MLLADIGTYLASAGIGLTLDVNLFRVPFPAAAPTAAACLMETPGEEDEFGSGPSLDLPALERARFQVQVRDDPQNAAACRALAESIRQKLNNLGPVTLGTTVYHDVKATTPVFFLGPDQNERWRWVCNFVAMKGNG